MELPLATDLTRDPDPLETCASYVCRLPLSMQRRRELLAMVYASRGAGVSDMMTRVHQALAGEPAGSDNPAYASTRSRLHLALGLPQAGAVPVIAKDARERARLVMAPPIKRVSMAPRAWPHDPLRSLFRKGSADPGARRDDGRAGADSPEPRGHWQRSAAIRRSLLLSLVIAQTYIATDFMTRVLPYHGRQPLEIAILVLFTVLFAWVSAGFWTGVVGFLQLLLGGNRSAISGSASDDAPIDDSARTAVIMPICNENVARVFAGLRATYESLERTGALRRFDFFVLSDTSEPDTRIAETHAWLSLCREVDGFRRVFYRRRRHRIKRKAGNVADFCRRWGANFRYMVVLDADSVMSGECLTKLVRLMEANPNAGIIQTAPRAAGRETLFARVQQFATRIYGPVYTAGLHFWQLGESHYWGHNAIIRIAPFMRHCALGRLRRRGERAREILSHDFVEAALMRRAGWAVWLAYDLPGSYEEMPPNLVDELARDQRWCLGNLINFRLFALQGLHAAHRVVFMTGVMAYLSAPLWFTSLLLSTALLALHSLSPPQYFVHPYQLFPLWPEWHPHLAMGLFGATAVLLLLPKFLGALFVCARGSKRYGGALRLALGVLAEMIISSLLAPIRMLFHTEFVLRALLRQGVSWKSPLREDAATSWREALLRHGWHTLLGVIWAAGVYWLNPSFLWWLLPVVGALILSIPLSVYTSRTTLGRRLRALRLFLIPEETWPPREIRQVRISLREATSPPGFIDAVVDPLVNAVACASGVPRSALHGRVALQRWQLIQRALVHGPASLSAGQQSALLDDPLALSRLHFLVWTSAAAAPVWREFSRQGSDQVTRDRTASGRRMPFDVVPA